MMKKITKIAAGIILILVMSLCFTSCSDHTKADPGNRANVDGSGQIVEPLNYGNGVYFFPTPDIDFGRSLSAFKGKHPELRYVDSTTCPNPEYYNAIFGYWVNFEPREEGKK
jgi:hypothetical protein